MLKLKLLYSGHLMQRTGSLEKTLILGKIEGKKRVTEDEMVGWHYQLNGQQFEQAPIDGEGQGSLGCCSPWKSLGQNIRVGSLSLLQGIFPTQGSNTGLPYCKEILYQLSHKGSQRILEW